MTTTDTTVPAGLLLLQQEVPENLVGKLPKVTCGDCRKKSCNRHKPSKCRICDGWLGEHMHLDFVGHAETTSKLLEADVEWNWQPMGFTAEGLPAFDDIGGLWIKLTVCGVTRLGYGTADNANGFKAKGDIRKEIIGDALRNAAMRFGWALNLWAKTDIHDRTPQDEADTQPAPATEAPRTTPRDRLVKPKGEDPWQGEAPPAAEPPHPTKPMLTKLAVLASVKRGVGSSREARLDLMRSFLPQERRAQIRSGNDLFLSEARYIIDLLEQEPDLPAPASAPNPRNGNAPVSPQVEAALSLPSLAQLVERADAAEGVFEQLKALIRDADTEAAVERLVLTALDAGRADHITHGQYDALCDLGRRRYDEMHADAGWSHRLITDRSAA